MTLEFVNIFILFHEQWLWFYFVILTVVPQIEIAPSWVNRFCWSIDDQFHCPSLELGQILSSDHGAPTQNFAPVWNWGKILSWGTRVPTDSDWGTSVPNNEFAPILDWGNGQVGAPMAPTSNLPQLQIGAILIWGTGSSNFEFAPTSIWGNSQVGAPMVPTSNLPQLQFGAIAKLGHQCSNFKFAPTSNWGNGQVGAPMVSTSNLLQFQIKNFFLKKVRYNGH